MKTMPRYLGIFAFGMMVVGCGSTVDTTPGVTDEDTGAADTGTAPDTRKPAPDTSEPDTATTEDTALPEDTATTPDTASPDTTTPTDTTSPDTTTPTDTPVSDTGTTDTATTDTATTDTATVDTAIADTAAPDTADTAMPLSIDAACTQYADDVCAKDSTCSAFLLRYEYGAIAKCKERTKLGCTIVMGASGLTVKPDDFAACGKAIGTMSCGDYYGGVVPAACDFTPGTRDNGTACFAGSSCKSEFCAFDPGTTCGACAAAPAAGAACIKGQCGGGLRCRGFSSTAAGTCEPFAEAGAACDATKKICRIGYSCFGAKCVAEVGSAGACDSASLTAADCNILQGLYCKPTLPTGTVGKCEFYGFAKATESCGDFPTGWILCEATGACQTTGGAKTGTCIAAAADGAACSTTAGPDCFSPAACLASTCKVASCG